VCGGGVGGHKMHRLPSTYLHFIQDIEVGAYY
jgi:hypothetical protein